MGVQNQKLGNYRIIPCINTKVEPDTFEKTFHEVGIKQRIFFNNESDLANKVTSLIIDTNLIQKRIDLDSRSYIEGTYKNSLAIEPEWSRKKISEMNVI